MDGTQVSETVLLTVAAIGAVGTVVAGVAGAVAVAVVERTRTSRVGRAERAAVYVGLLDAVDRLLVVMDEADSIGLSLDEMDEYIESAGKPSDNEAYVPDRARQRRDAILSAWPSAQREFRSALNRLEISAPQRVRDATAQFFDAFSDLTRTVFSGARGSVGDDQRVLALLAALTDVFRADIGAPGSMGLRRAVRNASK